MEGFEQLLQITRGGELPFIYIADSNAPPESLPDHWAPSLHARVASSGGTCAIGSGVSKIDYCLVSESLLPIVRGPTVDWHVPWSPHAGLWAKVERTTRAFKTRQLRNCGDFEFPALVCPAPGHIRVELRIGRRRAGDGLPPAQPAPLKAKPPAPTESKVPIE